MNLKKLLIVDAIIILIGGISILFFYLLTNIDYKKPSESQLLLNNTEIKDKYLYKDNQYIFSTLNNDSFEDVELKFIATPLEKHNPSKYYAFKIDGQKVYFSPTISIKELFEIVSIDLSLYDENNTYLQFIFTLKSNSTTFEFNILDSKINF